MIGEYKYMIHHGRYVKALRKMAGKHRKHCLCHQGCKKFKPGSADNCPVAERLFKLDKKFDLVTPVYECPYYEKETDVDLHEMKLCYIEEGCAFFTTQELEKQWGDDWNDAPYEHNAGIPYAPMYYHHSDGTKKRVEDDWEDGNPKWKICKVDFKVDALYPNNTHLNSPYSVEDINKKKTPWVRIDDVEIMAGEDLELFISKVTSGGGWVSEPVEVPPY